MRAIAAVRQHKGPAATAAAGVAAFAVYGVAAGAPHTFTYVATVLVAAGVVAVVHTRNPMPRGVIWALSVWAVAHMAGGLVDTGAGRVLYNTPVINTPLVDVAYDKVVHAFGFGTATYAVAVSLARRGGGGWIAWLAGMGIGAVNEVVEFIATQLGPTNVGGYENTGWDLVANGVGGVAALALARTLDRRRRARNLHTSGTDTFKGAI